MPKTVLPALQERSRKTLERLLKAAMEVLNKEGLDGATIPHIAARASLTPGSIYRRFPDKDALLREVFIRMLEINYRGSQELLKPEFWEGKSLAKICRYVIEETLNGHSRHRGLLRAFTSFTLQHPDTSFIRRCENLQWKVSRGVSDLLLARRDEIHHPDPESAIPFALLMIGVSAKSVLVLPRDPKHLSPLMPDAELRLRRELPEMVLRYLGIED
jgi:AcrR family transcriptional regulator